MFNENKVKKWIIIITSELETAAGGEWSRGQGDKPAIRRYRFSGVILKNGNGDIINSY